MTTDQTCAAPELNDDVITLLLSVARRADELVRTEAERAPERDFWREAEEEVCGWGVSCSRDASASLSMTA